MDPKLLEQIPKDCRGIIVADTNALFTLDVAISNDHLDPHIPDKPKKYIDILKYLSKQGYFIIIPEMVAFNCTHMTTLGKSVDDFFPKKNAGEHFTAVDYVTNALIDLKRETKKYPNISVWPLDENSNSPTASILRDLNKVIENSRNERTASASIKRVQSQIQSHFGKDAAIETITDVLSHLPFDKKLYFLTNDKEARIKFEALQKQYPGRTNLMTSKGFWAGIMDSGLALRLGFKIPVSLEAFEHDSRDNPHRASNYFTNLIDSSTPLISTARFLETDRPFLASLKELAADRPLPWANGVTEALVDKSAARRKFEERAAKTATILAKKNGVPSSGGNEGMGGIS